MKTWARMSSIGAAMLLASGSQAAPLVKSHLTHYGLWSASDIPTFQRFGLIALQPGMYASDATEQDAIANLRSKGTLVLLYLSIGEDDSTFNNAAPQKGDGRGPVRWNAATGTPVYENKGVASFYLDEWNANGIDSDSSNKVPDGVPDRQGDWGSCLVNAGDAAWQASVLAKAAKLMAEGADGLFLDTPETPDPWHGFGWTAPGMYDLIRKIRAAYPGKYMLMNRGLFFFDPDYVLQYQNNPRKLVDAVLFESYYTGSNYTTALGGNGIWRANPGFAENKFTAAPRLNAELGRYDSFGSIFSLDYAGDPMNIAASDATFFKNIVQETAVNQGWAPEINDRLLSLAPTAALDNPPAADKDAPHWQNTATNSASLTTPPKPRIGALKAIPSNGKVTLRWDVAADQTRPVRYNIYYSASGPIDYNASPHLYAVNAELSSDYTDRIPDRGNDACPYEYTVTGLANNTVYRFAVRAEDGTTGVTAPASGRQGPNGGIEETNVAYLLAAPRDSSAMPITVDGNFSDWDHVPEFPDSVGDGSGVDFQGMRITDDMDNAYFLVEATPSADRTKFAIYLNTDRKSFTGEDVVRGSGFQGADYKWDNGALYQWSAGGWNSTGKTTSVSQVGTRLELRISKRDIAGDTHAGFNVLLVSTDGKETLPKHGEIGIGYNYTHPLPGSGIRVPVPYSASTPLRTRLLAGSIRIEFSNPKGNADLSIYDLHGKLILQKRALTGTIFDLPQGNIPVAVVLIRLQARGETTVVQKSPLRASAQQP